MHKGILLTVLLYLVVTGCTKDDAIYQPVNTSYATQQPKDTALYLQVYPNPFDSLVNLAFNLPSAGYVQISFYAISGQMVYTLPQISAASGNNQLVLDLSNLMSGVYYLNIKSGKWSTTQRILKI